MALPITRQRDIPLKRFHITYTYSGINKTVCFFAEDKEDALKEAIELVPEIDLNGNNVIEVIEK